MQNNYRGARIALKKRAGQITVILMDVDGTMTDGSVTLLSQPDGTALEIKTFDAHDGQGLTLAQTAGLRTGCITGRESAALLRRAKEMKMEFIYMKQPLKMPAYEEILRKAGVADSAVAYVGDDLPDIPILRRAGLAVAQREPSQAAARFAKWLSLFSNPKAFGKRCSTKRVRDAIGQICNEPRCQPPK
jgi:YrbI family 3-deoxy-D-manno-octulosonate 8-phosphate phosphatase